MLGIRKWTQEQDDYSKAYFFFWRNEPQAGEQQCATLLELPDCIRRGVPYDTIENILERISVSRKTLAQILDLRIHQATAKTKRILRPR